MKKQPPSRDALLRAFKVCLRNLRAERKLAQERLAELAGIDRAYMGGLDRGKHMPSLETLYKISHAFGMTQAEFAACLDKALKRVKRPPPANDPGSARSPDNDAPGATVPPVESESPMLPARASRPRPPR